MRAFNIGAYIFRRKDNSWSKKCPAYGSTLILFDILLPSNTGTQCV